MRFRLISKFLYFFFVLLFVTNFSESGRTQTQITSSNIQNAQTLLEYRVVSQSEMDAWPVDKKRSGEKLWAETTWGGDSPKSKKLFNWNIWPCRVVFTVKDSGEVARGIAYWRRSVLSIRMKGLKLLCASTKEEITDARVVEYTQERVIIDFKPVSGQGTYYLYYAAGEPPLFKPSEAWLKKTEQCTNPIIATAERIEARCQLDNFYPMETIALKSETEQLLNRFPDSKYLVFPEDRDKPVKLQFEIPAHWALEGPKKEIVLNADRNEYRVFQLGLWACREDLANVSVEFSDLKSSSGTAIISANQLQCLTLTSKIKSLYIKKPADSYSIPRGQIRALWCGIDLPENISSGEYHGSVTVKPAGQIPAQLPIRLSISNQVVEERGDHDLRRLSRLRWIESDIGFSDTVYPPYKALTLSPDKHKISTWGHTLVVNQYGMPEKLSFSDKDIMVKPVWLSGKTGGKDAAWSDVDYTIIEATDGHVWWQGKAKSGDIFFNIDGRIEYDGCIVITVGLESGLSTTINDLTLKVLWQKDYAELASGMGYRGKRDGNRIWRETERGTRCFDPSLWLGSVSAGMGWITWDTKAWEDASRMDAATVTEKDDAVVLQLNMGSHQINKDKSWQMQFALRPTPVKPPDQRHWQFRYIHKGGGFAPSDDDTPQSFLKDNCKRLDELKELGVKRLNLHDWWGPAFNYPWQWDGPDNLSRLTAEAHKRGIRVKVYNSGRELSTLAPEFWALVYIGTEYKFRNEIISKPVGSFQDAWHENHLPDGLPQGWPRLHRDLGNEHAVPVSNATRNGNFYLESMRYMTKFFGTDGAYWDGADGPTLGHREMAKRLWTMFKETNPDAVIDAHHGTTLLESPVTSYMLVLPFIDSIWHGEGFPYNSLEPYAWLVDVSGLPFGIPSEMLGGDEYIAKGMLFGIWPRAGWGAGTENQKKLWAFFDRFGIQDAVMNGWWEKNNGITVDRPDIYVTAFSHPSNGVLLAVASWHPFLQHWVGSSIDVSLNLNRSLLKLPEGQLLASDILSGEELDIFKPVSLTTSEKPKREWFGLPESFDGRLIWVRGK